MARVLVTGANRGLGLEFVQQFSAAGTAVIATCRDPDAATALHQLASANPELVQIHALDVTDEEAIARVASDLADITLDVLINNAGHSPRGERFHNVRAPDMLDVFHANTVAPLMLMQALHPQLVRASAPRVANISSSMGSLARKEYGRHYSYSASKAALNMITRAAAHDLADEGITVVSLHPGWVQTDLGGVQATLSPRESVAGMCKVIASLQLADSGQFLTWSGEHHPW